MQPPSYAAGVRRRYLDLPAEVHAWVNAQLGEPADTVRDMHGGFSPGVAAVVSNRIRSLFVKAVGSAVNAESLRLYQVEREVASRIPDIDGILKPMSWADLDVDGETFAVMVFPALDGDTPTHPWRRVDLGEALEALQAISMKLTPSPWPTDASDHRLPQFLTGWTQIATDSEDPWLTDPWITTHLQALISAQDLLKPQLAGQTLTHTDLRADNIVMTSERVVFVDWAHARNAASWVDTAILIGDVIASRADLADGGDIDIAGLIRDHPPLRVVRYETVWQLIVALAGALHSLSRRPGPPGLPTIRFWQGLTADVLMSWCQRESPRP